VLESVVAHPSLNRERLRDRLSPGDGDSGRSRGSDAERTESTRTAVDDSQHGRYAEEGAQIDGGVAEPGRREVAGIEAGEHRVPAPIQERQGQPVVPGHHHRVALDLFE
jgi:hypothetical protein